MENFVLNVPELNLQITMPALHKHTELFYVDETNHQLIQSKTIIIPNLRTNKIFPWVFNWLMQQVNLPMTAYKPHLKSESPLEREFIQIDMYECVDVDIHEYVLVVCEAIQNAVQIKTEHAKIEEQTLQDEADEYVEDDVDFEVRGSDFVDNPTWLTKMIEGDDAD